MYKLGHAGGGLAVPEEGLVDRLGRTIADALITAVFQPVVDLQHGQIAGFEALTRPHESSGFADAGGLFEGAERAGVLWPLEELTRAAACTAAEGWAPGQLLFLNCSPQVFADSRFAAAMIGLVRRVEGLTPARVVLEITERSEQQYIEGLADQVALLKTHGFQIALDDVGAGSSGLNRLLTLRPHWLKLDRALVEAIDQDRVRQNLVRFLVHFSRVSGVRVIAEGIERREELEALIELGVVYGQGYYLGRPGAQVQELAPGIAAWLRDRCALTTASRPEEPAPDRVERFAAPVIVAEASEVVSDVLGPLLRSPHQPGIVVAERGRVVGWCPRERLIDASRRGGMGRPCGCLAQPGGGTIGPDATVSEALSLMAARDDGGAGDPLVVAEGGRVYGVLPLRTLLGAAADLVGHLHSRTTPVTGLPGRVSGDEHVVRQIRCAAEGQEADAAIVDIRQFTDYNGAYGYELGDRLLQHVADLLRLSVVRGDRRVFLAHLGDDRFLLTAPTGLLAERVMGLVERFEQATAANYEMLFPTSAEATVEVGLRVVLMPGIFGRIEEPRDLFRLYERIRPRTAPSAGCATYPVGARSIVIEERPALVRLQRLVA